MYATIVIIIVNFWVLPLGATVMLPAQYIIQIQTTYRKQQKLSGKKVSWFDRICENVEKTFAILLP